jgi:hypothetical protein
MNSGTHSVGISTNGVSPEDQPGLLGAGGGSGHAPLELGVGRELREGSQYLPPLHLISSENYSD